MHKVEINPIKKVELMSDCSLLTVGDSATNEKTMLLQRIQFLELENNELRKREDYLKMINAALLQALGNKDMLRNMANRLSQNHCTSSVNDNDQFMHTNKMNSFKKKNKQKKLDLEEAHRRSIETVYEPADVDPNLSSKKFDVFDDDTFELVKKERERERQTAKDSDVQRQSMSQKQRQKIFSKTKSPSFFESQQYKEIFKNTCYTPKVQNHALSRNNYNHSRKSINKFMQPPHLQSSFSKKEIYLNVSEKSQKSPMSSVSKRVSFGKNIATGLLCDLCGQSFSPVQFMAHAKQCQSIHDQNDHQLIKITDKSYQQDQSQSENEDLIQTLELQKQALLTQINRLKMSRNSPDKKLEKNLDQIVFIINNKKYLKEKNIKNLLKEKNSFSTVTTRKRERI